MRKIIKNTLIMMVYVPLVIFYVLLFCVVLFCIQLVPVARLKCALTVACKRVMFHILQAFLSHWFPHPIYVKYDKRILSHRKTITVSNHCSDYDWLFMLVIFHEFNIHDSRIFLKKSLGGIPLVGYIIRKFGHICLNRNRNKDIEIIKKSMATIRNSPSYNVAIYPEGTYLFSEALSNTRQFAKENNVTVDDEPFIPKLVLLPRKTGFNTITDCLRDDYDGVIDITIMMNPYVYMPSEDCPPFELFFNQKLVMNQFMLIDFIPKAKIRKDFLNRSFKRKEERLRAYIESTSGPVDTEAKFRATINKIESTGEDYCTKTITVRTPYAPILFTFPLIYICAMCFLLKYHYF